MSFSVSSLNSRRAEEGAGDNVAGEVQRGAEHVTNLEKSEKLYVEVTLQLSDEEQVGVSMTDCSLPWDSPAFPDRIRIWQAPYLFPFREHQDQLGSAIGLCKSDHSDCCLDSTVSYGSHAHFTFGG